MSKPRVYLAGPMAGLTIDEANKWRQDVTWQWGQYASFDTCRLFEFVNPCRNKEALRDHGHLGKMGYDGEFMCSNHAVFSRDTHDVLTSDALLVNFLGAPQVSVGTVFEIGLAWSQRIPIVSVLEEGNPYDHIFVRESSVEVVPSVEDGVRVLCSLFNLL